MGVCSQQIFSLQIFLYSLVQFADRSVVCRVSKLQLMPRSATDLDEATATTGHDEATATTGHDDRGQLTSADETVDERQPPSEPTDTSDDASASACFKTELCAYYPNCRKGDACSFAHGRNELRARPRTSNWKTSSCRYPPGACKYGHRCGYLHQGESKVCVGDQHFLLLSTPPIAALEPRALPTYWRLGPTFHMSPSGYTVPEAVQPWAPNFQC